MRHTENLGLSLYDREDKMNITGETESLNNNMQLLDAAIWDNKQNAISQSARIALLNCFEKVAWSDESGRELCEALRQELLINNSLNEYVVDGLELWFDGVKNNRLGHSSILRTWEDLSGNNHDMICFGDTKGTQAKTAQCGYNYVVFDGSTMFYNNDDIASLRTFNNGTLEIVFEQETSDSAQSIITSYTGTDSTEHSARIKNKGIWYRPASNGYRINSIDTDDTSSGFIMNVPTGKIAFSVSYVGDNYNVAVNGNTISDFTKGGTMPCNRTFAVGAKAWDRGGGDLYGFFGKIYTIRYYNRVLTPEEIAQNLSVDRKRFNF